MCQFCSSFELFVTVHFGYERKNFQKQFFPFSYEIPRQSQCYFLIQPLGWALLNMKRLGEIVDVTRADFFRVDDRFKNGKRKHRNDKQNFPFIIIIMLV